MSRELLEQMESYLEGVDKDAEDLSPDFLRWACRELVDLCRTYVLAKEALERQREETSHIQRQAEEALAQANRILQEAGRD